MESSFFKKEAPMHKKPIVIFDFDLTLSRFHTHGESRHLINELLKNNDEETKRIFANQIDQSTGQLNLIFDKEQDWTLEQQEFLWNKLKKENLLAPTGTKQEWQAIFKVLKEEDYPVYIASFSSFKFLIKRFLQEILEVDFKDMGIVSSLPQPQAAKKDDKNQHILNILLRENGDLPKGAKYEDISIPKNKEYERWGDTSQEGLDFWQQKCQKLLEDISFILFDDTLDNVNENGMQKHVKYLIRCATEEQEPLLKELLPKLGLGQSGIHVDAGKPDEIPAAIMASLKERFSLSFSPAQTLK